MGKMAGMFTKVGKVLKRLVGNVRIFDGQKKKVKEMRGKMGQGEFYTREIELRTFDGAGEATHPHVLYFEKGWNGYKYWMVYTPYENDRVEIEVPCMAVSNDGVNFVKVPGAPEPLVRALALREPVEYYSDPFLLFRDGRLEVWYRYTEEGKKVVNKIYRIWTKDGVNYSEPELMIDDDGGFYMSLSILEDGGKYLMYYFENGKMLVRESKDLKKWGGVKEVVLKGSEGIVWHGEVRRMGDEVVALVIDLSGNLYLAERDARGKFEKLRKLGFWYAPKGVFYNKVEPYKSSIVLAEGAYNIYVPFRVRTMKGLRERRKWKMTITRVKSIEKIEGL